LEFPTNASYGGLKSAPEPSRQRYEALPSPILLEETKERYTSAPVVVSSSNKTGKVGGVTEHRSRSWSSNTLDKTKKIMTKKLTTMMTNGRRNESVTCFLKGFFRVGGKTNESIEIVYES